MSTRLTHATIITLTDLAENGPFLVSVELNVTAKEVMTVPGRSA